MRERKEQFKNPEKYVLPLENIISLGENSEIRTIHRNKWLEGLRETGINWPVEIQGSGHSDYKKREFLVRYPKGDVILSSVVTIHELGHLRQGEINRNFRDKCLGNPDFQDSGGNEEPNYESEKDAWQRGFERAREYCPEYLQLLEERFSHFKEKGRFDNFGSFEDFYNYCVDISLRITKFLDGLPEDIDNKERGMRLGKMIKEDLKLNDFFSHQEKWRTGETIDDEKIRHFIFEVAQKTAEEVY